MSDPLDGGKPDFKRWEEFRAQYSSALLAHWVFRDLKAEAAEAVDDLWGRLQSSLCDYPEPLQQDAEAQGEEWDGYVPFHGRDGSQRTWLHTDDLAAIYASLFPHDLQNASIKSPMSGAAIVGVHSALEAYVKELGIDIRPGLVKVIRAHLAAQDVHLSAELAETLDDCDATRHVIVHNRGCVDEKYVRRVRDSVYRKGEVRVLTDELVDSFARAVFKVAELLRSHDDGKAPA